MTTVSLSRCTRTGGLPLETNISDTVWSETCYEWHSVEAVHSEPIIILPHSAMKPHNQQNCYTMYKKQVCEWRDRREEDTMDREQLLAEEIKNIRARLAEFEQREPEKEKF